jgi:hypothetical protein
MPGYDQPNDYNVFSRERQIGRIWKYAYKEHPWAKMPVWHWNWRDIPGEPDTEGHAPTLEAAMADFRKAWDKSTNSDVA